ncbi:MAG: hypothetical protein LBM93_13135, partial [Oscillospiraceae bacterium]|nr:hypothetical protein [Oscillospiraceae bacterium]
HGSNAGIRKLNKIKADSIRLSAFSVKICKFQSGDTVKNTKILLFRQKLCNSSYFVVELH